MAALPLSLGLASGSTVSPCFASRSFAPKGLILAQELGGQMATAGVCDVEEAWHGCPHGPHSCWQAGGSQGKASAAGHVASMGNYFILHTPRRGSVLGQVVLSLPDPRPVQGRAGWIRPPFWGTGGNLTTRTGAVLSRPSPSQEADPGLFYLLIATEASPASHLEPVCVSSMGAVPQAGLPLPSTQLPPSPRSILS